MTFGLSAIAVAEIGVAVAGAGIAVGAYESSQQAGISSEALGLASNQNARQAYSFNQLQTLMNNPGSFFDSPVYQAAFNQGSQAVARQSAAGGFTGSTNAAEALQTFGQSFGQQQLLSQEELLASMSGANVNPASALNPASGAGAQSFNPLGTLLAALGQTGSTLNGQPGGFTPGAAGSPGMGYDYGASSGIAPVAGGW